MAERYRFFNSAEGDIREYTASEFAEYFSRFLSNGIYVEDGEAGLKVSPGSGLSVNIAPGYAYLEGYLYENDTELTKEIEPADNVLNRIDRVVVRLDVTNRQILTHIKKGTFSSSPTPPTLVNTGDIVELSLAQVKVNANASTVQVVDERFTEHCGLVELLAEVPLNELMEQWNTWFSNRQKEISKYANTTGSNGNYIANINGITELLEGLKITVKFHEGRTGESFINLNGFGNTPIKKPGGGNPNIKANGVYSLVFDGLNFQLQGEGGEYGTATPNEVLEGYTIGTEQGLIEGILKLTGTALSNQVLAGRTFYNINAKTKITGTMPNRGTVSNTITTQGGSYTIPKGYHSGSGSVKAQFANLVAGNIREGVNIGGVVGTLVQGIKGESSGTDVLVNIASFDWWDGEEVDSIRRYKKVLKTNVISGKCTVHFQATGNLSNQPKTYLCRCYVYKNNNLIGSTSLYVRDVGLDEEEETTYKSIEINLSGSKDDEYEFRMDAEGRPTKAGIELGFKTTGIEIYN